MTQEPEHKITSAQEELLRRLAAAISSSKHNLVSRSARTELESRHLPECRNFAELLPAVGPLVDIGSGGGLPGLVVAILRPEIEVHLLEATQKKARFLVDTAADLGLAVTVHPERAETFGRGAGRGAYRVLTARAVAPLKKLVGWAAPLMASEGALYAIKGERWDEELEEARPLLAKHGLTVTGDPRSDPRLGPSPARPRAPRVVMLSRSS